MLYPLRALISVLILCAAVTAGWSGPAYSQEERSVELPPGEVKVSTPDYSLEVVGLGEREFSPELGTYTFKVGWQGIPAATLTLTTEQRGLYYRVLATARTYRGVELFYKLRYHAEGLVSSLDFSPVRSSFLKKENSKERLTEISFLEDRQVHVVQAGSGREREEVRFDPQNHMLEPFSAAFLARGLEWNVGKVRTFDTFNGKSRYLITLTCTDETNLNVNGEPRRVWVIEPKVRNLTKSRDDKKLRQAQIFITADSRREILRISSEVFIGSVSAWLESFRPAAIPQGGTMVAQASRNFSFE